MADKEKTEEKKSEKKQEKKEKQKSEKSEKKVRPVEQVYESLVRILGFDVPGNKNLYTGLTKIKGISWAISNFVCLKLGFSRSKKISDLTKPEIKQIEDFVKTLNAPDFIKNRRFDRETGESKHVYGVDLDLKREFDIKRLKQIKSYKGLRHALKLPVRGQKTRSHFRERGRTGAGIKKRQKEAKQ